MSAVSRDVIGYCSESSSEDLVTLERFDYKTQDVVLIFSESKNGRVSGVAECILRKDLRKMYGDSTLAEYGTREKLFKMPFSGVFVKGIQTILDSKERSTFVLDEGQELEVTSRHGVSGVHGNFLVKTVRFPDPNDPVIAEIEAAEHDPRIDNSEVEIKEEEKAREIYNTDYRDWAGQLYIPMYDDEFLLQRSGNNVDLTGQFGPLDDEGNPTPLKRVILKNSTNLVSITVPHTVTEIEFNSCSFRQIPPLPDNLEVLKCIDCPNLVLLPEWPESLIRFVCINCPSLEMPVLPDGVEYSEQDDTVNYNPDGIEIKDGTIAYQRGNDEEVNLNDFQQLERVIIIANNTIQQLTLPNLVTGIMYDSCLVPDLPPFSDTLTHIEIVNCTNITSLPPLPPNLWQLICVDCSNLMTLPALPGTLNYLSIVRCNIQILPLLPDGLLTLTCNHCSSLTGIPNIPISLEIMDCDGCTSLTEINGSTSNLEYFSCIGCPLEEVVQPTVQVEEVEEEIHLAPRTLTFDEDDE